MKINLVLITRYLFALLFIYAGVYKISDVGLFASQMYQSPLLPFQFVPALSIALPVFEIVLGFTLIFYSRFAYLLLWVCFSLMLLFSLYLIMLFTLYSKPPCACGGILSGMTYPTHIVFNLAYTILAVVAIFTYKKKDTLQNLNKLYLNSKDHDQALS